MSKDKGDKKPASRSAKSTARTAAKPSVSTPTKPPVPRTRRVPTSALVPVITMCFKAVDTGGVVVTLQFAPRLLPGYDVYVHIKFTDMPAPNDFDTVHSDEPPSLEIDPMDRTKFRPIAPDPTTGMYQASSHMFEGTCTCHTTSNCGADDVFTARAYIYYRYVASTGAIKHTLDIIDIVKPCSDIIGNCP